LNGLTYKERNFCEQWMLKTGNATQAAIAAGYAPERARATASELMRRETVQDYIADLQTEQAIRHSIDASVLTRQLLDIACGGVDSGTVEYVYSELKPGTSDNSRARYEIFKANAEMFVKSGEMVTVADKLFLKIPKCSRSATAGERVKAIELLGRLTGAFTTASLTAKEEFKRMLAASTAEINLPEVVDVPQLEGEG